ncbi:MULTISPECIES: Hsp20/alpha crystallin family protein [unclassified Janthinobacterium]|jgi:HSP20 family protein|uniref:Hsp20/alpha crystallin family protein n=1 Tax=unclassified Janthinobacterium TaxID=2610881 RepID=UPI000C6FF0BE|nr:MULTISPECIES: Hsp20/alpha crystallin family protein [unclassified Janthinobacterium]PKV43702.1 HSP20 family protein [Janthinobacterium sp. 61]TDY36070.1 HSP20 family protein [Janthinobacterium sp. 75]
MVNRLTRFDPFSDIARFEPLNGIEDWFRDFQLRPSLRDWNVEPRIKIDVSETDVAYTVKAEIPGVKKEDIKVDVEGGVVSITAELKHESEVETGKLLRTERTYGEQRRSFTLAQDIDDAKVVASYADGVLTLSLPKKSGKASQHIPIS